MKKNLVCLVMAVVMLLTMAPAIAVAEEVPTVTVMLSDNGRTWVPDTSNNAAIQENLGVKLDVTIVDKDTLTLSFASGDMADIITMPGLTFAEFVNTGYLLPLNDLLQTNGQQLLDCTTEFAWSLTTLGENIYAIPYENNNVKYFTYMRKDWLDKIGFDLENHDMVEGSADVYYITLDEYTEILDKFTHADPDGNGVDDTYGMSTCGKNTSDYFFMAIFGAFGGLMTQNYEIDGAVYPYEVTDEYRAALEYLNTQWEAGVIDPEIFIYEKDQAYANMMSGKSGTFVGWWSTAYELIRDDMWNLQPEAEWCTVEIVGPDGKVGMKDNGRVTSTISITSFCENPELAMDVLNYMSTDEGWWLTRYGVEGEHYTKDADGYPTRTEEGAALFQSMQLDSLYTLTNRIEEENFANSAPQGDVKLEVRRSMLVHQFLTEAPLYTDLFYGVPQTQEDMDYSVDVDNLIQKSAMQFVTGEVELNDDTWADYIKQWKSMGGAEILASYVNACNELKGTEYVAGI